jgi:uncharacterized protein (DUF58 family)
VPTTRGWALAGTVLGAYLAGWLSGYVELSVLATAALVALLLGRALLPRPVGLRVARHVAPERVPRGGAALTVLSVVNSGRRRTPVLSTSDDEAMLEIPRVPAGGSVTLSRPLPTPARGEHRIGPLRVVATDPLGLFRRAYALGPAATVLVLPATVALPPEATGRHGVPGEEFRSLREYVPGDDLRHVHWRSSARTGSLLVRQYDRAEAARAALLLDLRAEAYPDLDSFELAVEVAASLAVAAAPESAHELLDRLARVQVGGAGTPPLRLPGPAALVTGAAGPPLAARYRVELRTGTPAGAQPSDVDTVTVAALSTLPAQWRDYLARAEP